jgi:hypothetical protein
MKNPGHIFIEAEDFVTKTYELQKFDLKSAFCFSDKKACTDILFLFSLLSYQ